MYIQNNFLIFLLVRSAFLSHWLSCTVTQYFSGLSMHWFDSAVFFSAAPMITLVVPLYMYRLLSIGLIVLPLEVHSGFGSWTLHHYIHHSKFNWNYGNSPMWDHIMGTNYPNQGEKKQDSKQERQAANQVAMVHCNIGKDLKDVTNKSED